MNLKALPGFALAWFRRSRYRCLIIMVLLGLILRENYPFSHFPMFSSFGNHSYLVHLADANGAPVRTKGFGLANSGLNKIFDRNRRSELIHFAGSGPNRVSLAEQGAGEALWNYLDGLVAKRPKGNAQLAGLRLEKLTVRQEGSNLLVETTTLAQHQ